MLRLAEHQKELFQKPQLRYLYFELTDRCNLSCLHCGSSCTFGNHTFLEYSVIERVLRDVAATYDPGEIMICLTGGEPLLHPDLCRVVALAHELGFAVGMTTNGTLIDRDTARCLAAAGLDTMAVSIDGVGPVHDGLRCREGAFDLALEGIRSMREAGIRPQALTVVHHGNIGHLEELFDFLQRNGFDSWRLVNMDPIGRGAQQRELLLSPNEMTQLFGFIRDKRFSQDSSMEVTYGCSHFVGFEYERMVRDYYFQCIAGTRTASVMANGDIGACLDIVRRPDLIQGNVYSDDFVKVWEERFQVFRRDRSKQSKTCSGCEYAPVCMGDSAHTWDYDRNEPGYCMAMRKVIHVVAAVIRDGDRIFATERGYGEYKGWWEFPGGKIEEGETGPEALMREIREELDTQIAVEDLIDTVEYDYPTFHLIMDCFWCSVTEGDLVLKEASHAMWLTKETLGSVKWLPADLLLLEKIQGAL